MEFFRRYVTRGSKTFLQAFNGYRNLKPFMYTLYENPESPSLVDSGCLKRFGLSVMRIAWSEFVKKGGPSSKDEGFSGQDLVRSIYGRVRESASEEEEEAFSRVFEISRDRRKRVYSVFEEVIYLHTVKSILAKAKESSLSRQQQEAIEKLHSTAEEIFSERSSTYKRLLSRYVNRDTGGEENAGSPQEKGEGKEIDLDEVLGDKAYYDYAAKRFYKENRVLDRNAVSRVVDQVFSRASVNSKDLSPFIEDLKESVKGAILKPGTVTMSDIRSIPENAEAIGLAREIFSYYKRLEEIRDRLEQVKLEIQRIEQAAGSQERVTRPRPGPGSKSPGGKPGIQGERGGKGGGGEEGDEEAPIELPQNVKKRVEETFSSLIKELSILAEMLDFLTRKTEKRSLFEAIKRALSNLLRAISNLLRQIAEALGLDKLLTLEGILAVLSELAIQLT